MAIEEDVDAVAMSLFSNGAHLTLFPQSFKLLKEEGIDDILLIGGVVPAKGDKQILEIEK